MEAKFYYDKLNIFFRISQNLGTMFEPMEAQNTLRITESGLRMRLQI